MKNKNLILKKTHDFYKTESPRLTIVMIHGIASDSSTYNSALAYLEEAEPLKEVRFITFDLLGSGQSLKSDELNYDYEEQIEALNNSIQDSKITTPLILVGHSLGTFIVTKYAEVYKGSVRKLILISPPVYTPEDFKNPAFMAGMELFKNTVSAKDPKILDEKSFKNSIDKIVLNKDNYKTLCKLKTPAVLIYGAGDQIVASYNIPRLLQGNAEYLSAIKTSGRHGISQDKYSEICKVLEEDLNA